MPNGPHNWRFRDVELFLKARGFRLNHTNGSHFYFVGIVGPRLRQVCVPFHGSAAIKPRVLVSVVRQSGIDRKVWFADNKKR